ncbi:MAG: AmmeMemoRadiSam system radical SAM enzyme [Elusimicrobia bacterium]|nr:AmmeMemoRadiSam system radical SAM enzyme [Elusimicrobiota bacterium]
MREALYYETGEKGNTVCELCPNRCEIARGKRGICGIRQNENGKLFSLTYGKISSINFDPIEKKPLYHFYPGRSILSIGSVGCNFRCPWCQNFEISQTSFDGDALRETAPEALIQLARTYDSPGIAYTYNEPLINYEFLYDCSKEFHKNGLKNVIVSNGYICEKPFANLIPFIDAANIDIKFFNDSGYRKYTGGKLGDILRSVEMLHKAKKHIELTLCLIPGLNDSKAEFSDFVDWVWALSPDIPLHLSRYFPAYKFHRYPTPLKTMHSLRDIAIKKLNYVYLGNVFEESNTYCPKCKTVLIRRKGYLVEKENLKDGICQNCGEILPFIF